MRINELPPYDPTDNETGCCPRFYPEPWDNQDLHFENKPFVRASTVSLFHVPLNMGSVYGRTQKAIEQAHAEGGGFLVLSHDESAWHAEHLFAVSQDVPGAEMVHLSGDFATKVFEGSYSDTPRWCEAMKEVAASRGKQLETLYYFYTTCPKCAKHYGRNYVVGVAKLA
ncbi:MAG: hydrolase [Vicinamibacterales bacterium]